MSSNEYLERLYRVFPWSEDPFTERGLRRYQASLSEFKAMLSHGWFRFTGGRRELKLVDLCSGTGIGGIALAKVLVESGFSVSLTLIDLRRDALSKAVEFGLRELGFKPEVLVSDVVELNTAGLERVFDVALMWGLTTPHFSPWDWIRILRNISRILVDNGLFIYDEADRVYTVFYTMGYKEVLPELAEKNRVILTIHKDKDFKMGYFNRLALDLISNEREEMKVYFWDIASSAAFTWIFFNDVDYIPTRKPYSGIIIARKPRRSINLEESFRETPKLLNYN